MDQRPTWLNVPTQLKRFLWLEALVLVAIFATFVGLSVGPRFFGYSSFVVYGGSMEPGIPKGSVAVAKPLPPSSVQPGDVIVYRLSGSALPTLHRVLTVEEVDGVINVTTKGDANQTIDPETIQLTGTGSKVVYAVPYLGYILHAHNAGWSKHIFITFPALALAAMALWTIWSPKKTEPEAETNLVNRHHLPRPRVSL
jgi:signal peptidase